MSDETAATVGRWAVRCFVFVLISTLMGVVRGIDRVSLGEFLAHEVWPTLVALWVFWRVI